MSNHIAVAIRTYFREQLGFTLTSLLNTHLRVDLYLAYHPFDLQARSTPQCILMDALRQRGSTITYLRHEGGVGAALFALLKELRDVQPQKRYKHIYFMDADVVFTAGHMDTLASCLSDNCRHAAYYVMRENDPEFTAWFEDLARSRILVEPYFHVLNAPHLSCIPLDELALLRNLHGTEHLFYNRLLVEYGFNPVGLTCPDRPLHIIDLNERRARWREVPVQVMERHTMEALRASSVQAAYDVCKAHSMEVLR